MTAYSDALHAHLHRYFHGHPSGIRRWDGGKAWNLVADQEFHVVEIAPGPRTEHWTYVSVGSGTVEPKEGRRLEFILCAPEPSPRHIEIVDVTAFYHLDGNTLDVGHTVPIGKPWMPGSSLDHLLVTLPYPFGRDLEELTSDEYHAHLLLLVPIAESEARLRHDRGLDFLESRFESTGMDYSDPFRPIVPEQDAWWKRW